MRSTAAAAVAVTVLCLAATVSATTTVLEIADDAGYVAIGTSLDTTLTRKSAGTLGATNLQVDANLVVQGTTTLGVAGSGPVNVNYNLAVTGTTQLTGATTVLNDLYVTGIIRHANAAYHRTRLMGITAKIYAGNVQQLTPSATVVLGFTTGGSGTQTGVGTYNDAWFFSAHKSWQGSDISTPTPGFSIQNGFATPTDPATNGQLPGYYRFTGAATFGGCTEQSNAGIVSPTNAAATTWRALYITQSYGSATDPFYYSNPPAALRYFGGSVVRDLYPKEATISVSDTIFMNNGAWAWLSFASNCLAPSTISTLQPIGPPSSGGGSPTALPGPYAAFSMTYIGE